MSDLFENNQNSDLCLSIKNGVPIADSREVAKKFDKRHDHVLRDIDNILKSLVPQNWGAGFFERKEFNPAAAGRFYASRHGIWKGCPAVGHRKSGNSSDHYYLNEGQACVICAKSEASKAPDAREEIIRGFMAYRHD